MVFVKGRALVAIEGRSRESWRRQVITQECPHSAISPVGEKGLAFRLGLLAFLLKPVFCFGSVTKAGLRPPPPPQQIGSSEGGAFQLWVHAMDQHYLSKQHPDSRGFASFIHKRGGGLAPFSLPSLLVLKFCAQIEFSEEVKAPFVKLTLFRLFHNPPFSIVGFWRVLAVCFILVV